MTPVPTMTSEQVLSHYGWTIECQSPYEIRNADGSTYEIEPVQPAAA